MTAPAWFVDVLTGYFAAWHQTPTPPMVTAYWQTLEGCEEGSIRQAALDLQRAGGEFPRSSGDWYRKAIDLECTERLRETIKLAREEPWKVECQIGCEDTGFLPRHCLGTGQDDCRFCRQYGPRDHEWVEPCSCRERNRTYQRKRERERIRPLQDAKPRRDKGTTGGWSKTSARDWTAAS